MLVCCLLATVLIALLALAWRRPDPHHEFILEFVKSLR
jgi:hypothetical protein